MIENLDDIIGEAGRLETRVRGVLDLARPFESKLRRGDVNEFNERLLRRVNDKRRVFITSTRLDGAYVLRLAILSFRTHGRHVRAAVEDVVEAALELEQE